MISLGRLLKTIAPAAVTLSTLVACGGGANPDLQNPNLGGVDFKGSQVTVLEGQDSLLFSDDGVQGIGKFRFNDLFDKVESAKNYVATIELPPNGEIKFYSHGKEDLSRAIEVTLSRDAQGNWSGRGEAGTQGFDFPPGFASSSESEIFFSFDVHNDHGSTAHLVFWTAATGAEAFEDILYGLGYGVFYGVELNNAALTNFTVQGPREVH